MKNLFWFCFVILILISPLTSKAQSNKSVPNLIDTVWKQPDFPFDTSSGPAITLDFYAFEKDGKVSRRILSLLQSQINAIPNYQTPEYNSQINSFIEGLDSSSINSPNRLVLSATPGLVVQVDAVGTYRLDGNTLYMEFSGRSTVCNNCPPYSIIAKIDGSKITGEYTGKTEKTKWSVSKISNSKSNNSSNTSNPTNSENTSNTSNTRNSTSTISGAFEMLKEAAQFSLLEIEELRKLETYKAATRFLYKDKEIIICTLIIKIKSIDNEGGIIAEIKGEKGISLTGTLTGDMSSYRSLKGVVSVDFGKGLGTQKLDFFLSVEKVDVKEKSLINGAIQTGSVQRRERVAVGEFIRADSIMQNK